MKLKQITKLLFIAFLAFTVVACNSSDTEYTTQTLSADAQIYSFKVSAKPDTKLDTLNYPILAKTAFTIDQLNRRIFNLETLPFGTRLKKFAVTISYNTSYPPSKVELIYPESTEEWNGTDSVDFALNPEFKITASNGQSTRTYRIDFQIRDNDPELIEWSPATLKLPTSITSRQKTLLKGEEFYTFSLNGTNLVLNRAQMSSSTYGNTENTNASNIVLESITLYNGKFYAIDTANKPYVSENGTSWQQKSGDVNAIIGVVPDEEATKDILLVIIKSADDYIFAKTTDMETIYPVRALNNLEKEKFPVLGGFSSATNINRDNTNQNILSITGGKNAAGEWINTTWSFQLNKSGELQVNSSQNHYVFAAKEGLASFIYNNKLYALTNQKLYKSTYGQGWIVAPDKEQPADYAKASFESVIVDQDNYIWIFGGIPDGGTAPDSKILKGRLNSLIP